MTDVTFIDEGTLTASKYATSFDGIRGPNDAEGYYTPLTSYGDYIYLAENTHASDTLTGHIAKIDKATHSTVQQQSIGSMGWINGTGVAVAGHASAAAGVSGLGTVIAHRGAHAHNLDARYTTTPEDLSTITSVTDPAGANVRADYRRFWRAPNGTLWLYVRGNDGKGELYKWNDTTDSLTRIGSPISDYGSSTGSYAVNLTFASNGDIYAVTEALLAATSGFPCNYIGCVKSTDDGATWTELDGTSITLPLNLSNQTDVAGGTTADHVVAAQITLDENDNPVIIFGWENNPEGDNFLATWIAHWNGTSFDYFRMYPEIGDGSDELGQWQNSKVIPQIMSHNGTRIVVMKEVGTGVTQRLVLLTQYPEDSPAVWHRWVLENSDLYTGAYVDKHSLEDDGLLRIYPVTSGDLVGYDQSSELWEFNLPTLEGWGNRQTYEDVLTNSYTDTPTDSDTYYRYRVAAVDTGSATASDFSAWVQSDPVPVILGERLYYDGTDWKNRKRQVFDGTDYI